MSGMKNKVYRLSQENKVYCEDLIKIDDSVFENVYKQVDNILYKITQYNNKLNENSKYINRTEEKYDENVLNTIPFLAGRGRGKTSALLSVLNNLNKRLSYFFYCILTIIFIISVYILIFLNIFVKRIPHFR